MKLINKVLLLSVVVLTLHSKPLPVEPSLISAQLANGFKYTIKKNAKPAAKAEMRLIVNVGSLEEDEDQKGVAHLVEHMAFNGSEHFPKNTLVSYLESIGVAFGSHLNASTSTTRTLYKLSVPLEKENLQKSFLIFEDWAAGLSFNPQELEKERGVVLEEARSRDNLNFRLYQQRKDTLYANSKYKDRTPIGDLDIIKNIKVQRVKDFYTKWYRPELMHLVVVGDIDVKDIQEQIIKHFSHLQNTTDAKTVSRTVPKIDKRRVLFTDDKELTSNSVSIHYFNSLTRLNTTEEFKKNILRTLAMSTYNLENSEQLNKKEPALNAVRTSSFNLGDKLQVVTFNASFNAGKEKAALSELSSSIYQNSKFGFSQDSFNSVIENMKNANETAYKKLGDGESKSYTSKIVSHILSKTTYINEEFQYQFLKETLEEVKLQDVNNAYKELLSEKSQLILFSSQKSLNLTKPTVLQTIDRARKEVTKRKEARALPKSLLTKELKTKEVVYEKYNKKHDFWEFTLQNDLKVIYKHNNYKKKAVNLAAYSKGGYSLIETDKLTNAKFATSLIGKSGTTNYSLKEFKKIYAGKSVSLSPYISRYSEGIRGRSTDKDFEVLLELVYLAYTNNALNENILENIKRISIEKIKQENKNPQTKFSKEFTDFSMKNSPRYSRSGINEIQTLNKKDILGIYKDRFSDANNFIFIITGDIDYDKVKTLSQKYLANLPTLKREESYKDRGEREIQGKHNFIKNYEDREISTIRLKYTTQTHYSLKEALKLDALKDLLNIKLRELIREEKSGVYGVSVRASISRIPEEKATLTISFTCDPKRRQELTKYVRDVVKEVQATPVEQKYLTALIKKNVSAFEKNIPTDRFWQRKLKEHSFYGDSLDEINNYTNIYHSLTPAITKEMANKYLQEINFIYSELNPKENNTTTPRQ